MKAKNPLARKLRSAVGMHRITARDLALAAGVSEGSAKAWLSGGIEPQGVNRENLAHLFGVNATVFGYRGEVSEWDAIRAFAGAWGTAPIRHYVETGEPVIDMKAGAIIGRIAADEVGTVSPIRKNTRASRNVERQ
jgi:transcriptional regulator with XRE-family HTH domain